MSTTFTVNYKNIEIYLGYLKKKLAKDVFEQDFFIEKEFKVKNVENIKGYRFYNIVVSCSKEIGRLDDYKSIINGPIPKIMELKGITNIAFGPKDTGTIILIYPLSFFENDEYFKSLKSINKYEL